MVICLLVDDRERIVITHLRDLTESRFAPYQQYAANIIYTRLTTSDYAIAECDDENHILRTIAMVERKTYEDFASSFVDGRIDNIARMIEIRAESQSRVMVLLEGCAPYDGVIGGIPVKNIYAKIDHLWLRDCVACMRTMDVRETAHYLIGLLKNTITLREDADRKSEPAPFANMVVGNLVQRKLPEPTTGERIRAMLIACPKIGAASAAKIAEELPRHGMSLASLFQDTQMQDRVRVMGAYVSRLYNFICANTDESLIGMLATLRGITRLHAVDIVQRAGGARNLCALSLAELRRVTQLGEKTGGVVYACLHEGEK